MKKLLIVLIMGLNVSSCTFSQQPKDKGKDFNSMLEESLKRDNYVIPDSLFSFFPDKSDKYKYLKIDFISESAKRLKTPLHFSNFVSIKIIETYRCENKESLLQLMNEYRLQSLFSVKSENSDYFVIESERVLSKEYDTVQLKEKYLLAGNKIILFFKELFEDMPFLHDTATISGLPVGYEILVLKSGNEFILPENYLHDWLILPQNLRHGYRSGVAFKEGEPYIIYWTVAW